MRQRTREKPPTYVVSLPTPPRMSLLKGKDAVLAVQQQREAQRQKIIDALLETVRRDWAKRRKTRKRVLAGTVTYLLFVLTVAVFAYNRYMLDILCFMGIIMAATYTMSQTHKNSARQLAEFGGIRSVGPLAEALEFKEAEVRTVSAKALIRLLPQLQASDASLLDTEQRACLHRALNGKNANLTLVILQALEQVGDSKAIPFVEKLATGKSRASKNVQIRHAAVHCLQFLTLRAQQEEQRQTLLRGSAAYIADPTTLLRPASTNAKSGDAGQLLRSCDTETPLR